MTTPAIHDTSHAYVTHTDDGQAVLNIISGTDRHAFALSRDQMSMIVGTMYPSMQTCRFCGGTGVQGRPGKEETCLACGGAGRS